MNYFRKMMVILHHAQIFKQNINIVVGKNSIVLEQIVNINVEQIIIVANKIQKFYCGKKSIALEQINNIDAEQIIIVANKILTWKKIYVLLWNKVFVFLRNNHHSSAENRFLRYIYLFLNY